jgi:hypothetical protein
MRRVFNEGRCAADFAQGPAAFVVSMLFASKTNDFSSTTRYNSNVKNTKIILSTALPVYPYSSATVEFSSLKS